MSFVWIFQTDYKFIRFGVEKEFSLSLSEKCEKSRNSRSLMDKIFSKGTKSHNNAFM